MIKEKLTAFVYEEDKSLILKRSAIWNMVASVLNSTLSSILLFFITRLNGVNAAGMFSIASAIAYQCLSLGNFGSRNVQAADTNKEFSFSDFFFIRVLSAALMYSMLLYYSFGSGYTHEKALVVLTFGIFKSIDAIEDVFHGEYHRNNRLDIAAVLLTFRYTVAIIGFVLVYALTKDLIITSLLSSVTTILIFIVENKSMIGIFYHDKIKFKKDSFKRLLLILIPICVSNYVRMYVCNLPKYSIDKNLNESFQTYFNILIMPVFIITLLSDVIFRPFITRLSVCWHNHDFKEFKKLLVYQLSFITVLTIVIIAGGYIIGLKLLEIVYAVELSEYMSSLMILLIAGGFNTASAFLTLVLTIQREQKKFTIVYIVTTIIAVLISDYLVVQYEIIGASVLYLFICFSFFAIFMMLVIYKIKTFEKRKDE